MITAIPLERFTDLGHEWRELAYRPALQPNVLPEMVWAYHGDLIHEAMRDRLWWLINAKAWVIAPRQIGPDGDCRWLGRVRSDLEPAAVHRLAAAEIEGRYLRSAAAKASHRPHRRPVARVA